MKFTDRYIKVPVRVFDTQQHELTNKESWECDYLDTYRKVLPMRIECYEPAMPGGMGFGKDKQTAINIVMQSGEEFLAYITIEEFEKLLNNFEKNT